MTLAIIDSDIVPDPDAIPADLAEQIARLKPCTHCGGRHTRACPRVRRMKFHPNGTLAAVEFWPEGKWSDEHVIWPEDMETDEETA